MHAQILKYFTTVAELGTIRAAAKRLHISASAINRQILNLEELIGEPVFELRIPVETGHRFRNKVDSDFGGRPTTSGLVTGPIRGV